MKLVEPVESLEPLVQMPVQHLRHLRQDQRLVEAAVPGNPLVPRRLVRLEPPLVRIHT